MFLFNCNHISLVHAILKFQRNEIVILKFQEAGSFIPFWAILENFSLSLFFEISNINVINANFMQKSQHLRYDYVAFQTIFVISKKFLLYCSNIIIFGSGHLEISRSWLFYYIPFWAILKFQTNEVVILKFQEAGSFIIFLFGPS